MRSGFDNLRQKLAVTGDRRERMQVSAGSAHTGASRTDAGAASGRAGVSAGASRTDAAAAVARAVAERKDAAATAARRSAWIAGLIVVLAVAASLMVPAFSATHSEPTCGFKEHTHNSACYKKELVCDKDGDPDHVHSDDCFELKLVCEIPEHTHTDACYEQVKEPESEAPSETAAGESSAGHADADAAEQAGGKNDAVETDLPAEAIVFEAEEDIAQKDAGGEGPGGTAGGAGIEDAAGGADDGAVGETVGVAGDADAVAVDGGVDDAAGGSGVGDGSGANGDGDGNGAGAADAAGAAGAADAAGAAGGEADTDGAADGTAGPGGEADTGGNGANGTQAQGTPDGADGASEPSGATAVAYEQVLTGELKDVEGAVTLAVTVYAPEGALPQGATMKLGRVHAATVQDLVDKVVLTRTEADIAEIQGVDLAFYDQNEQKATPEQPLVVKFASNLIAGAAEVAHFDAQGNVAAVPVFDEKAAREAGVDVDAHEVACAVEEDGVYAIVTFAEAKGASGAVVAEGTAPTEDGVTDAGASGADGAVGAGDDGESGENHENRDGGPTFITSDGDVVSADSGHEGDGGAAADGAGNDGADDAGSADGGDADTDADADTASSADSDAADQGGRQFITTDEPEASDEAADSDADHDAEDAEDAGDLGGDTDPDPTDAPAVPDEEAAAQWPARTFKGSLDVEDGTVTVSVVVEAPEGAFPEKTSMVLAPVSAADVEEQVAAAVRQANGLAVKAKQVAAVDIAFVDSAGGKIEPRRPVKVQITSDAVRDAENLALVHVEGDYASDTTAADLAANVADVASAVVDATANDTPLNTAPSTTPASDSASAEVVQEVELVRSPAASAGGADTSSSPAAARPREGAKDTLEFEATRFSPYVIVDLIAITTEVITASGETYNVTVTYNMDAEIPDGATLAAREIVEGADLYGEYVAQAENALGWNAGSASYARLFDIEILDANGAKVQPAQGSKVGVSVQLLDKESLSAEACTVHFGDTAEVLGTTVAGDTVNFEAGSFSVYAIVEAPEPVADTGWSKVASLDELVARGGDGLYIGHVSGYYFTDQIVSDIGGKKGQTGIVKTSKVANPGEAQGAVPYYFEQTESAGQFRIYCLAANGETKLYLVQSGESLSFSSFESQATAFKVSAFANATATFRMQGSGNYCCNMHSGEKGQGFASWANVNDQNAKFNFYYYTRMDDDPYGLDGQTYGIAYHNDDVTGAALGTASKTSGNQLRLMGTGLVIRPDILHNTGVLLVSPDSDIAQWTFHVVSENRYRISTEVDGATKYLAIRGTSAVLLDEAEALGTASDGAGSDDASAAGSNGAAETIVTITPGTGEYSGKYRLSVGKYALNLNGGKASNGFEGSTTTGGTAWLNLVEKSKDLDDDDFTTYTARKVSVSDTESVTNGRQVIIYTRIWNETTLKYEFYAIDHDGSLVRCFESGDVIQWVGGKVNTALWNFTEYYYEGTTEPNHYYDLQSDYSGVYIAPQLKGDQVFSSDTIGLNLNGRRYGDNYTKIIAWDDPYYEYVGLKVQDGRVVACPLSQAEDFYFALVETADVAELTEVETVDSDEFGISMKMVDYNNPIVNDRDPVQTELLGLNTNKADLLNRYLEEDGYPNTNPTATGKEQGSLKGLFEDAKSVNHLFIQNTYNESGYFEYDSTKNFAYLGDGDTFTVYDQIATINTGNPSLHHGQFMPYNTLINPKTGKAWPYSTRYYNTTTTLDVELPDSDPRKGEKLIEIPYKRAYPTTSDEMPYVAADYFFGMELSASFTQTVNGLDAWGHDLIFEFSGDDDMWLYVDDALVLDLGGVHAAQSGTVNFRTGAVKTSRVTTTLRNLYDQAYRAQHPEADDAAVTAYLDGVFVTGGTVFRDYSTHTMKMLYMERGAGASNLHMRFNLAASKPNTVVLGKKISGTEKQDYTLAEFPYQVFYTTKDSDELLQLALVDESGAPSVTYQGTRTPVKSADTYTPAGGKREYASVFFLKPGQYAEVKLPENTVSYRVVECGVNGAIYDKVLANEVALEGVDDDGDGRLDYAVQDAPIDARPRVEYDNHVDAGALRTLTITKKLFAEDGTTELGRDDDATTFAFRLYLGNENDDEPKLAYMQSYLVKDEEGRYCKQDRTTESFASLGKKDYDKLTEAEKTAATFLTSPNGSISKIPAGYSVEVRELVVGAKFKVEERTSEVPAGYRLVKYDREEGSYIVDDGETVNSGVIRDNSDPAIQVHNQRGWGITVKKSWSDASFVSSREPVYFAVFTRGAGAGDAGVGTAGAGDGAGDAAAGAGDAAAATGGATGAGAAGEAEVGGATGTDEDGEQLVLVEGTVRQLGYGTKSLYWGFDSLDEGRAFADYVVREVVLTGGSIQVDDDGIVTGYGAVAPVADGGQIVVRGTAKGGTDETELGYRVNYQQGEATGAAKDKELRNVRVDTVTNTRPGIRFVKTDWTGSALAGATFTLQDKDGADVGASTYVSDDEGLITIAYLEDGTYTLTETKSPSGYRGLTAPIEVVVSNHGSTVALAGAEADAGAYEYQAAYGESVTDSADAATSAMATVKVRNRTFTLRALKKDAGNGYDGLAGVHFALYRQVKESDGNVRKDYTPIEGCTDLVSDGNGYIPGITEKLAPGTYYLTETQALAGYSRLNGDVMFTLGPAGVVTVEAGSDRVLEEQVGQGGTVNYTITISNARALQKLRIKKVDILKPHESALEGAKFDLYSVSSGTGAAAGVREAAAKRAAEPLYTGLTSNAEGYLAYDEAGTSDGTAAGDGAGASDGAATNDGARSGTSDGAAAKEAAGDGAEASTVSTVLELPLGTYELVETEAPQGFLQKQEPVKITVTESGVTYDEGTSLSSSASQEGRQVDTALGITTLLVSNGAGTELPNTGGPGTAPLYALGLALLLAACALLHREVTGGLSLRHLFRATRVGCGRLRLGSQEEQI